MSTLDDPAIGRRLRWTEQRWEILRNTPRSEWPKLARAYLSEIGCPEDDQAIVLPGVLYVWSQLIKEGNNVPEQPRPDKPQPDRTGS